MRLGCMLTWVERQRSPCAHKHCRCSRQICAIRKEGLQQAQNSLQRRQAHSATYALQKRIIKGSVTFIHNISPDDGLRA